MEVEIDKEQNDSMGEHTFEIDGLTLEFKEVGDDFEISWRTQMENGKLDKDVIFALAFLIANPTQQEALLPVKTTEKRVFRQVKRVRLTKDMKAGSELMVPFKFTVDAEMLLSVSQGGLYVPKK